MRIGGVFEWKTNAFYRSIGPLEEMRRRGHEVAFANTDEDDVHGVFRPRELRGKDVIHAYRALGSEEHRVVRRLVLGGAALVWDTDDDLVSLPRESPDYASNGGRNARLIFERTVEYARLADVVTTTTEALADRYREEGIERIEVIENYLPSDMIGGHSRRHPGFVVGWVAGLEHGSELARIPIEDALRRVADAYPDVRIETIGLRLDLPPDRYRHTPKCPWPDLQKRMAEWDVGIAPLADIPFNRARSNVKLKEYAGIGLPWLASPVGPYMSLGEAEGGRLVHDDGWFDAISALVASGRDRRKLGRAAGKWAKRQSIARHVDRWEAVLDEAVQRRQRRGALV